MSVYNSKYNTVFIHIPKVAGTSISEILGGEGHKSMQYYRDFLRRDCRAMDYESIFKFAFVRNPMDRLVSAYTHIHRESKKTKAFEPFLEDLLEGKITDIRVRPMVRFICNKYGRLFVDFVGRYENLDSDWKRVCGKIGIKRGLNHSNKQNHKPYLEFYKEERSVAVVKKVYREDFELFYPTCL